MSMGYQVTSDHQLARLLQIGIVLEEVVEARAYHHHEEMGDDSLDEEMGDDSLDEEIRDLLSHAAEESAEHRGRLEDIIDRLDVESIPFEEIEALVEAQYGQTKPEDFDGVLYDQLCNEETAYKFYDDVIKAVEASDAQFTIDREELLATLSEIRDEEADGVEEVTKIMEERE
ncbi:ferritin-like domain-containing protein [Haloferax sp. DFSO60]|uniref:ferritin-like domain-containing protein n=1 Tax=Haloferax sp. DFSO60 TaxID=3388652 RepID=UPI003978DFC0